MRHFTLFAFLAFFAFGNHLGAQTTLGLGDIAFTGYKSDDPDQFSFVLLKDITAGTQISITDNGWFSGGGGFRATEGTLVWTASSSLSCGTEVTFTANVPSTGTVTGTGPSLAVAGDQLFAYQGTAPADTSAAEVAKFIAAIQMNGAWDANATDANSSAKPSVFTDGVNSISISPEVDNAVYNCVVTGTSPDTIRAAVNNSANWTVSDVSVTVPSGCAFSCGQGGACAITNIQLISTTCNDQGTSDPNDDAVAICFIVTGQNVGSGFSINGGGNFAYNTQVCGTFAPGSAFWGTFSVFVADTGDPTCSSSFTVVAPGPCSSIPPCSGLFISEYVEGSGFNKCIEIYNSSGADINLASFGLFLSFNGGTFENTIPLMGTVKSGDVYVICHTSAAPEFTALADQLSPDLNFNGNDVVILEDQTTVWDAMGQLGNTANFGLNVTLRRKFNVQNGDNNPFNPFSAAAEWDTYPQNTSWGLGYHRTACVSTLPIGWNAVTIGCPGGSSSFSGNTFTLTSNCFNPAGGQDDLTFDFQQLCGDGEIIAYTEVTSPGFAGLMFRESVAAGSKYVWLYTRGDSRAYLNTRATTNGNPQTSHKPHLNRKWLRLSREGNTFRGYLSQNGSSWQLVFQVNVPMNQCMFVGLAAHSYVDGASIAGTFSNVSIMGGVVPLVGNSETAVLETPAVHQLEMGIEPNLQDLQVRPNPAFDRLEVVLPHTTEDQVFIRIHDINGKQLFADRVDRYDNIVTLDLDGMNLSPGVYLISVNNGSEVVTRRFVKAGR
jgi:hypothetical protein